MQLPDPLAVQNVGLAPAHVLDQAGHFHQIDLQAAALQDVRTPGSSTRPVDSIATVSMPAPFQPVGQTRCRSTVKLAKTRTGLIGPVFGHRGPNLSRANIQPGRVEVDLLQDVLS